MKVIVCLDCQETVERTGANQKRCKACAKKKQKAAVRAWMTDPLKNPKYTGTGSGAHNTLGAAHPQWKGGERRFGQVLAPAYFKKQRYCERCGKDLIDSAPSERCVHHIDHDRKNNVESNFELLCKRCHQLEHECWLALPQYKRD